MPGPIQTKGQNRMRKITLMLAAALLSACGDSIAKDGCHQIGLFSGSGAADRFRAAWNIRRVDGGMMFETTGGGSPIANDSGTVYTDLQVEIAYGQGRGCPESGDEGG